MTYQECIKAAASVGGSYIQQRGWGACATWVLLKSYPGHSNGVFYVSRSGHVDRR
jgi:hypothetical protein